MVRFTPLRISLCSMRAWRFLISSDVKVPCPPYCSLPPGSHRRARGLRTLVVSRRFTVASRAAAAPPRAPRPTFSTKVSHNAWTPATRCAWWEALRGGRVISEGLGPGNTARGLVRRVAGGAAPAELQVRRDVVVAARRGDAGRHRDQRRLVAERADERQVEILDRPALLADQVRVGPGIAPVVAMALPDAQLEH